MEKVLAVALLIGLAALIAVSIRQDRKPRVVGKTPMISWLLVGVAATAAEFITIFYALSLFLQP